MCEALQRFQTELRGFSRSIRWHTDSNVSRMDSGMETVTTTSGDPSPLVLVVDDSPDARAMYGDYLRICGFRVVTAKNGEEGVAVAQTEGPAVIVMDLAMPQMDGWEAIRHLREDPCTAAIPIIALSAYAFGNAPRRAREAGADLCLSKPCLPPQVARVVRAMLSSSRGSSQ
jgi:two-component system, cell cycle response regulator DivK